MDYLRELMDLYLFLFASLMKHETVFFGQEKILLKMVYSVWAKFMNKFIDRPIALQSTLLIVNGLSYTFIRWNKHQLK